MKERRQDQWLHDYLDGRLSAAERAQAEARIRDDAGLARRLEAWRKIGKALREDAAELPPGFYTRARARFEQSLEPRPRFGHRLFSWEAAGVTAVMLLAAALFVPELMPDRSREPASARPAEKAAPGETRKDVAKERAAAFAPEPVETAVAGADAPARAELESDPSDREEFAPAPLAEPGRMPRARADTRAIRFLASEALGPTANAVALPQRVRVPDGIRVIDDRSTWDVWLAGPAGPALSRLGGHQPGRRLVLVGRPGGIDCSTVTVSRVQNEYRVAFDGGGGPTGGCAFVLSGAAGTVVVLGE